MDPDEELALCAAKALEAAVTLAMAIAAGAGALPDRGSCPCFVR
jgi:hypothetical protein